VVNIFYYFKDLKAKVGQIRVTKGLGPDIVTKVGHLVYLQKAGLCMGICAADVKGAILAPVAKA
jgi:hypothetical protein